MCKFKQISLNKCAFDLLICPGDEQFVVVICLEMRMSEAGNRKFNLEYTFDAQAWSVSTKRHVLE